MAPIHRRARDAFAVEACAVAGDFRVDRRAARLRRPTHQRFQSVTTGVRSLDYVEAARASGAPPLATAFLRGYTTRP